MEENTIERTMITTLLNPPLPQGDGSGSLYPTDEQILEMVENFIKDLNLSKGTKRAIQFGYQEGLYKMVEIWKQSNNDR